MRTSKIASFVVIGLLATGSWMLASEAGSHITPDEAMRLLTEGNARFVQDAYKHPDGNAARREETAAGGQHPFATILSCSDSRVPLELVFDQGIGDIFVVRVAGNVCGVSEIGSIEYGVDHVGTPLLVVLGHTQCGAVTAAAMHAEVHGGIKSLVDHITPALADAQKANPDVHGKDLIPAATEANVWRSLEDLLTQSEMVRHSIQSGHAKAVGAIYDVKNGQVHWLGEHPRQAELLKSHK